MELTGLDSQLIHELLLNQIKTIVKSSFNPKKADSIFTQSKVYLFREIFNKYRTHNSN